MEINVKRWTKNNLTRYYLTDESGTDLGYAQEETLSRSSDNHYDAHRITKGDAEKFVVTHTVENEAVLDAITHKNLNGDRKRKAQWIPGEAIIVGDA